MNTYSLETEQAIISALLTDNKNTYIINKINIEDFYYEANREIFQAIKTLYNQDKQIDPVTIIPKLKAKNIELSYLNEIMFKVLSTKNIESYVSTLKEKSIRRQLIEECNKAIEEVCTTEEDPVAIKSALAQKLDSIGHIEQEESDALSDIISKLYDKLEAGENEGYLTGIADLDRLTAGLHKEETIIVAARPGVGKTAIALQASLHLAKKNIPSLIISKEMSKLQVAKRFVASSCDIDGNKLRTHKLTDEDLTKISDSMAKLYNLPVYINTNCRTITDIKAKLRETKAEVLFVDYIQLLSATGKHQNREQQVAELSRELKNISLDFKIPVVILSQLNRQADTRRPGLADLRESGAIEQDANVVIFLHLPTAEEIKEAIEDEQSILSMHLIELVKGRGNKLVECIVAKQRDGETGQFYMEYVPNRLTFKTYTRRE